MKAAVAAFWGSVITSCVTLGFILRPAKIGHVDKEHLYKLQTSDSVVAATRKSWSERSILSFYLGLSTFGCQKEIYCVAIFKDINKNVLFFDRCHSIGRFLGMEGNPAFSTIAQLFTSLFKVIDH